MTDSESRDWLRLDWMDENPDRLADVRGRMLSEDESIREAVDWLMQVPDGNGT